MDRERNDQHIRRRRRWLIAGAATILVGGISLALARLQPAAPTVERNLVWVDTVKRGPMLRQVRGAGILSPEEIRWIAARTEGRVETILLRPGAAVQPEDVILLLSNPDVRQAAADADSQLKAVEAELATLEVNLQSAVLAAEAVAASVRAEYEQSKLRAAVNDRSFALGLIAELDMRLYKVTAEQAATRHEIEQKRLAFAKNAVAPQLAAKRAEVERFRAQAKLRHDERAALEVRAGMVGVLQLLPVEVGAQVAPGANLARVADPTRLKGELRIAQIQAQDVQIGQIARIDTRTGIVAGRVARIDPSVQDGTVTVDVALTDPLPRGARSDLSVDGIIELERLGEVVFVGRPSYGEERSTVDMYKLDATGDYAIRTSVRLGRSSVDAVEILSGLKPGDRVILSDPSSWSGASRIHLN